MYLKETRSSSFVLVCYTATSCAWQEAWNIGNVGEIPSVESSAYILDIYVYGYNTAQEEIQMYSWSSILQL